AGRTVRNHPLVVKRYKKIEDIENTHVLFISSSEKGRIAENLKALKGKKILTVGESEQFCRATGMVGFIMSQGSVRFGINVEAAKQAGLKISAELLRLATIIRSAREE